MVGVSYASLSIVLLLYYYTVYTVLCRLRLNIIYNIGYSVIYFIDFEVALRWCKAELRTCFVHVAGSTLSRSQSSFPHSITSPRIAKGGNALRLER